MSITRRTALRGMAVGTAYALVSAQELAGAAQSPGGAEGLPGKDTQMNMIARQSAFQAESTLLVLGKELDRLIEEWRVAYAFMQEKCEEWDELSDEAGIPWYDKSGPITNDQIKEWFNLQRQCGAESAINAEHEVCLRIDAVNKRIRAIRPTTVAELAVWAKATRFDCIHSALFEADPDEIEDWTDECLARFLREIERMANAPEPAAAEDDLSVLDGLMAAHNQALLQYDRCSDEEWDVDERRREIDAKINASRNALLAHRPRTLTEVRAKASFMARDRAFGTWDDIEAQVMIRSLSPV